MAAAPKETSTTVWPRLGSFLALRSDQFEYVELILLAVMVGVLGALGNLGFRELIDFFSYLFMDVEWHALGIRLYSLHASLIPVILLSGGAGILALNWFFPGDVMGYGFPHFLEMVNLGNARIKRTWIVVKALGAALSLGSGASVGREGPIAQIGGAIGSAVAQMRRLSAERAKVLVAAGAGAGIATTFNAPIGGLMFAQEIVLLNQTELANLSLLIIATMSAVVTSRALTGNAAVFVPAPFELKSYWEMVTYGVMGITIGAIAAGYIHVVHQVADFFRRLPWPDWVKLGVGLLAVGLIAIPLPQNLSDGYPVINHALQGHFTLARMSALAAAKFFASAISLGCGAPGGVFGPIFFIGTMCGGTIQRVFAKLLPSFTGSRGSYAFVGLGAFLSSATHAPMTALFLLFETTRDLQITLPAMITVVLSMLVARAIEPESIDTFALARAGKSLEIGKERLVLSQIPVSAVMTHEVDTLSENSSLADVLRIAGETAQAIVPVVDGEGGLSGIIVTHQLLALLGGGNELGPLVNAYDLAWRNSPIVTPVTTLDEAAQLMEYDALDELPVVEDEHGGKFLGLVTRRAIAQTFNRVSVSLSTLATRESNIYWATGYRVSRVAVPEAAAGKTLRELDPRARFEVSVLAVRNRDDPASGFVPIAPDRALKSGDELIVAGRPPGVRQFARQLQEA
ncbi:MAG TPA: chloride channel protein [Candidatus Binataceae bacterium]|nr:chloride channel protein [Candidatus Binataceae bacterium]